MQAIVHAADIQDRDGGLLLTNGSLVWTVSVSAEALRRQWVPGDEVPDWAEGHVLRNQP
jgi:hypothetical protein